jgi:enoyl-CoA hydratase/carnithine racemase
MNDDHVLYDQDGAVVTLTLNRPEELNAFSEAAMIDAFEAALIRYRDDPSARCAILTGAGRAFSAGGNVKHMRDRTDMFAGTAADIEKAYVDGPQRIPAVFWPLEKPVIAAVNGPAYGIALDLVCMSDIRIASTEAKFGAPFTRIGIAPGDGAAWFLTRVVGSAVAAEMILTADPLDAERARQVGLVSRVTSPDDLLPAARAMADRVAGNAPLAVALSKRLLRKAPEQDLDTHLKLCAAYQALLHGTEDHIEAVTALLEKRPPDFKGC